MNARCFYGRRPVPAPHPDDRGLAYGDGVFETIRVDGGVPLWWSRHVERLIAGAGGLGIPAPEPDWLYQVASPLLTGEAVLKLVLTRGLGGRGYAPPERPEPGLFLSRHPLPAVLAGLRLDWSGMPMTAAPQLAGIKHLNRLDQVLAAAALAPGFDAAVLCDPGGHPICTTLGNVFVRIEGRWCTPRLDACGIAGICRAWLLERIDVEVSDLTRRQVAEAEAMFVCNSVRGILPVTRLGSREWAPEAETGRLRRLLAAEWPAHFLPESRCP